MCHTSRTFFSGSQYISCVHNQALRWSGVDLFYVGNTACAYGRRARSCAVRLIVGTAIIKEHLIAVRHGWCARRAYALASLILIGWELRWPMREACTRVLLRAHSRTNAPITVSYSTEWKAWRFTDTDACDKQSRTRDYFHSLVTAR